MKGGVYMSPNERKLLDEIFQVLANYNITNKRAKEIFEMAQFRLNINVGMYIGDKIKLNGYSINDDIPVLNFMRQWEEAPVDATPDYKCHSEGDELHYASKCVSSGM